MKKIPFKHYFKVEKGVFSFENKEMFEYKRLNLEGKRGYAIIEEVEEEISVDQYGYYFGGIIRGECMRSNTFAGLSDRQIHSILFSDIRSFTKGILMPDGTTRLVTVMEDFHSYKKRDMSKYIEEVIPHLQTVYDIHPKPSSHYKYNKFYIDPKIYINERSNNELEAGT